MAVAAADTARVAVAVAVAVATTAAPRERPKLRLAEPLLAAVMTIRMPQFIKKRQKNTMANAVAT